MVGVVCADAAAYSQAPVRDSHLPAMVHTPPPQHEATAPRPLRLLERAGPLRRPPVPSAWSSQPAAPADWAARLGRWMRRLLAA
jgi:hypothetical protein